MSITAKQNRKTRTVPEMVRVYINGEYFTSMSPTVYAHWRRAKQDTGFNGLIEANAE